MSTYQGSRASVRGPSVSTIGVGASDITGASYWDKCWAQSVAGADAELDLAP